MRDLVQPGQFACEERVFIETAKTRMALRVLGPVRRDTQVEISMSDAVALGIQAPIRMSGDLQNSPGAVLVNKDRRIEIPQGVIVASRHLHIARDEAVSFGVKNGDMVSIAVPGPRAIVFNNVAVRSGDGHVLEAHIDKDEANASGLVDGALCSLLLPQKPALSSSGNTEPSAKQEKPSVQTDKRMFLGESDVLAAHNNGVTCIEVAKRAVITPLARDAASRYGIDIRNKE
jgi:putative phosphotransacetylase